MPVDTSWTEVAVALGAGLLAVVVVMATTAYAAHRQGRIAVVDVAWGLGFVLVAVASAAVGTTARGLLLVVLVAIWGFRLAWHIGQRQHESPGEDPRYRNLLDTPVAAGGLGEAVRKVLLVQGPAMWVVALPVMLGAVTGSPWPWAVWLGLLVWLVGLVFEAVGDAQLAAYRQRPRHERPPVLDTGLWGWTRHPNYFGDACVWWGLWLVGGLASGWLVGLVTLVAPLVMTHVLRNVTGAAALERTLSVRAGWAEYAARVPMFVPRPPPAPSPRTTR